MTKSVRDIVEYARLFYEDETDEEFSWDEFLDDIYSAALDIESDLEEAENCVGWMLEALQEGNVQEAVRLADSYLKIPPVGHDLSRDQLVHWWNKKPFQRGQESVREH